MQAEYSTPIPPSYNDDEDDEDNTTDKNDLEEKDDNRLNMNKRENLELELQNKINEMNNWILREF
ncbi:19192_t:CDS:2 [Cetraspora pellucida]|uniref:19192_t:CDS:1 n=1 Tax=Cetraspora pellucida TaxID=1433469 RepID=A0A9N9HJS4_9GLOM|nr:19192_t:CDS:2 [Cetraspora pellucida]